MDFNVTEYEKFIDMGLSSTLQLTRFGIVKSESPQLSKWATDVLLLFPITYCVRWVFFITFNRNNISQQIESRSRY